MQPSTRTNSDAPDVATSCVFWCVRFYNALYHNIFKLNLLFTAFCAPHKAISAGFFLCVQTFKIRSIKGDIRKVEQTHLVYYLNSLSFKAAAAASSILLLIDRVLLGSAIGKWNKIVGKYILTFFWTLKTQQMFWNATSSTCTLQKVKNVQN